MEIADNEINHTFSCSLYYFHFYLQFNGPLTYSECLEVKVTRFNKIGSRGKYSILTDLFINILTRCILLSLCFHRSPTFGEYRKNYCHGGHRGLGPWTGSY